MKLIDWIVTLVIMLMAIAYFCARRPAAWSCHNRARHLTGMRLLMQAACALWAALLIAANGLFSIDGLHGMQPSPTEALAGVALLVVCGGYWSVRGRQMLKPRRVFARC